MSENLELQPIVFDHPDNEENKLADDAEIDALVKDISTDILPLNGDDV